MTIPANASLVPRTLRGEHALVIGGGIAGLAAASVLTRHFARVTVLERDPYPDTPGVRPHTPHGAHAHLLLAGGLVSLSRLFPQLPGWLDEAGVPEGDLTHHTRAAYEGRWLPRARSGIPIRTCTRTDVERVLLRVARAHANLVILDGCRVDELLGADRVRGVRFTRDGAPEELEADLVVDAMGRASPAMRWLQETGRAAVEEVKVDPGVVYTSAWFEPPDDIDDDWTVLATLPARPRESRMGFVVRVAPDRLLCSTVSYGKPQVPKDTAEMTRFFGSLCVPQLHGVVRASKPLSEPTNYGNTQNRRRRLGKLRGFPDGLVVLGDAACSLNPRYGQGMTVAALSVERLDEVLASWPQSTLAGFSVHFQAALDAALTVPWQMALLEDRGWVSTLAGTRSGPLERLLLAGSQRVLRTAFSDLDTYIRFMRVAHLLDAPTTMLAPRTLAAIARGGRSGGTAADAPGIGSGGAARGVG